MVRRVRSAVDRVHQRPFARRTESRRKRHEHLHRLPAPPCDSEFLHVAERVAREQRAIERFERPLALAVACSREQRRRMPRRVTGVREHAAIRRACEARDHAARHELRGRSVGNRMPPQADTAPILDERQQAGRIGRPLQVRRRTVEARGQRAPGARAPIEKPQLALVVERTRRVVCMERDPLAVRRVQRMFVGAFARGRDAPHAPPREVDDDHVATVHQSRFGLRIDRQRELASVG